jgi:hypothetical protein
MFYCVDILLAILIRPTPIIPLIHVLDIGNIEAAKLVNLEVTA